MKGIICSEPVTVTISHLLHVNLTQYIDLKMIILLPLWFSRVYDHNYGLLYKDV